MIKVCHSTPVSLVQYIPDHLARYVLSMTAAQYGKLSEIPSCTQQVYYRTLVHLGTAIWDGTYKAYRMRS